MCFSAQPPQDILEGLKAKWEQAGARSLDHGYARDQITIVFVFLMLSHIIEHTDSYEQCNYIVYIYIYISLSLSLYIYITISIT